MKSSYVILLTLVLLFLVTRNMMKAQNPIKDLKAQFAKEPGVIVDVRTKPEWDGGHYPKAIFANWNSGEFQKLAETWDKEKTYYLYCASGGRSGQATSYLKQKGFKKVYNLGGYSNLKAIE